MEGYIYVLFDAYAGRCKIGRTRQLGSKRQRAIMGGHHSKTLNIVNAKVEDCISAETQCHRHFAKHRTNGEWFDVDLAEVVSYVHGELDWCEIDFESPGIVTQYIFEARRQVGRMAA